MSRKKSASVPLQLIQVSLELLPRDGQWAVEFSSSSKLFDPRSGDFDLRSAGEAVICVSLVGSPGCRFPSSSDACVGFSKKSCPGTPDEKDHDVFRDIAVSDDGRGLVFYNANRGGKYWYSLFVERGEELIVIDPKIINK